MTSTNENPLALIPELCLLAGAVVGLLVGLFVPRRRQWLVRLITALALAGGIGAAAAAMTRPAELVFDGSYTVDAGLGVVRIVVLAATLLTLCLSVEVIAGHPRETEFYVLLLLGALGSVALAGASDLMVLAAAYLLASVPLYALAGFFKDALGTEAALKYYLMGALLGIVMLAGVTLLYGVGGATVYGQLREPLASAPHGAVAVGIVALLAGLLFKTGAVPAHFWVPDVTEGAATPVAAFVTSVPKLGGLLALYRLVADALPQVSVDLPLLIAVIATASMTLGNLAAFFQDSPRRLLAYSTISQVGYLLLAVAAAGRSDLALGSLTFYLAAYAVTNLGAFAVVAELPRARRLQDYGGLFHYDRWLALTLVVCLLGLVGTPPTSVFVGKLTVFSAALDAGLGWLAVVAAVNTVASVFYYLRWIAPLFLRTPAERPADALQPAGTWARAAAYTAGTASVLLGLASGLVLTGLAGPVRLGM
jgi:NADH-quinone oxidoreductase subunit N